MTTPENVEDYEAHEGVRLEPDRMHFNPGMRAIAKHELNSFWGKFGESPNKVTTEYITEVATWLRLATSPRHDVHAIYPVNQDMIMVMYNLHEEHTDSLNNDMCTSVSIVGYPDATMVEFGYPGPKNYGFWVSTGATKVKVRGISLTVRVRETLNWTRWLMAITNVVEDVSTGLSPEEAADEHAMTVEYPHSIRRAGHALKKIVSGDMCKTQKKQKL